MEKVLRELVEGPTFSVSSPSFCDFIHKIQYLASYLAAALAILHLW